VWAARQQAYSRVAVLLSEVGHHDVGMRVLESFQLNAPESPDALKAKLQLVEMRGQQSHAGMPDHYQVMGLQRTASSDDVRCVWIPTLVFFFFFSPPPFFWCVGAPSACRH
jgi:hypothetical protein